MKKIYVDGTVHEIGCCTEQTSVEELLPCKNQLFVCLWLETNIDCVCICLYVNEMPLEGKTDSVKLLKHG